MTWASEAISWRHRLCVHCTAQHCSGVAASEQSTRLPADVDGVLTAAVWRCDCVTVCVQVGKSALVERFANERWNPSLTSTIGGSFLAKAVQIEGKDGHAKTVTLGVWSDQHTNSGVSMGAGWVQRSAVARISLRPDLIQLPSAPDVSRQLHLRV